MTVNGKSQPFTQNGRYVEARVRFEGVRFGQAEQVALERGANGEFTGSFNVPQRILDQLAARKRQWPIPWTAEDCESTWLAPERLLLFLQAADAKDTAGVTAWLDDKPLDFRPAYSAGRVEPPTFVGFYADLSGITAGVRHTIKVNISGLDPARVQGIFFDNVEPQLTESIQP
jgi:hypothetical protein